MNKFLDGALAQFKQYPSVIVFPEVHDNRVVKAAMELASSNLATPVMLTTAATSHHIGQAESRYTAEFRTEFRKYSLNDLYSAAAPSLINGAADTTPVILDVDENTNSLQMQEFIQKHKQTTEQLSPLAIAALLLADQKVDAVIAGAATATADVIRTGLKKVGLAPHTKTVSSCFLMLTADGEPLIFADCAIVPQPNPAQLADIAIASAAVYKKLCGAPAKVAMLSFSTKGSAQHSEVDKVQEAMRIIESRNPDFEYDGELQFDAAIDASVAATKTPNSKIAGKANVFIFPDLNSGNIGYKIAQRLGGVTAIGPLIMGLKYPLMDLSRGCSVDDIIAVAVITGIMAKSSKPSYQSHHKVPR